MSVFPVSIFCFLLVLEFMLNSRIWNDSIFELFFACARQMDVFCGLSCLWGQSWPWFIQFIEAPPFGLLNSALVFHRRCSFLPIVAVYIQLHQNIYHIEFTFMFSQSLNPNVRGTQRDYSSKTLKHSIVKRILVLNGSYRRIFIP